MTTLSSGAASSDIISRSFTVDGDARTLEKQKKSSDIRGFTINCDEREPMGDNTAPPPLAYFASSILF